MKTSMWTFTFLVVGGVILANVIAGANQPGVNAVWTGLNQLWQIGINPAGPGGNGY